MSTESQNPGRGNDASPEPYTAISNPPRTFRRGRRLATSADVYQAMFDIRGAAREHFVAFYLDARHRLISREILAIGSLTGVEVHPREVYRPAILAPAAALIVSHNHPSGDPTPSLQDIELTRRLRGVGELLGISFLDHIVVAIDGFVSMSDKSLY